MIRLVLKLRWFHAVFVAVMVFVGMAAMSNVSTRLQPEDVLAIKAILGVQVKSEINSYEDEVRVIRWAQAQVLKAAPGMEAIPNDANREPLDLLKAQSGLCYDRSRTLDKVYKWLGFESRHVYILFAEIGENTGFWNFLKHAFSYSSSHAVTEVQTSRGWLMVGSNSNWVSINKDGLPIPAGQVFERRSEFDNPPDWVNTPLWAIRGLYSRKGQLYRPHLWMPDINWPDFLSWVATGLGNPRCDARHGIAPGALLWRQGAVVA